MNRRRALAALAAGLVAARAGRAATGAPGAQSAPGTADAGPDGAPARLRILVLGGTRFIGRQLVDQARARGHALTLFNRGRSDPGVIPGVEQLRGDRAGDLAALRGRDWDAVVDTSGYVLRDVRTSAELLAGHVARYLFISSISVYASFARPNDEDSPLATTSDPAAAKVTNENYGALKALCEGAVEAALPGRATIVRPGYVVGPEDYTDRFTYWPVRVARGGEMLAPGTPADPVQFVDVRDLAAFCLRCLERDVSGVFNAVHAPGFATMGSLLDASRRVTGSDAAPTWVPAEFLVRRKALDDLPIWSPPVGETAGDHLTRNDRAVRAGLATTPLEATIRDTLAWHRGRPAAEQEKLDAGLTPEAERELLAAWRAERRAG
jgi:2'-hydroxyisoflavone reductase